jgi:hypothetical protein
MKKTILVAMFISLLFLMIGEVAFANNQMVDKAKQPILKPPYSLSWVAIPLPYHANSNIMTFGVQASAISASMPGWVNSSKKPVPFNPFKEGYNLTLFGFVSNFNYEVQAIGIPNTNPNVLAWWLDFKLPQGTTAGFNVGIRQCKIGKPTICDVFYLDSTKGNNVSLFSLDNQIEPNANGFGYVIEQ